MSTSLESGGGDPSPRSSRSLSNSKEKNEMDIDPSVGDSSMSLKLSQSPIPCSSGITVSSSSPSVPPLETSSHGSDKKEIEIIELSSGGLDDTYEDMESTPELDVVLTEAKTTIERDNCFNFAKRQEKKSAPKDTGNKY